MDTISHSSARPMTVKIALTYLALDCGVATVMGIYYGRWDVSFYYYMFGSGLILDFVPLWFAFRRKNWARWFVVIYTVWNVCDDPMWWNRYHQTYSTFQTVWFGLSDLLDIIAVILLFHPSSNRWFRGHQMPPN